MLALIVVASLPLGWLAMKRQQHQRAARELARCGGHVIYDYSPTGRWPAWPALWRMLARTDLGDGILWDPYQVSFYPANATDDTLLHLHHFRAAKVLALGECRITNAGLVHIVGFKDLRILDRSQTQITDAGLDHLASLTNLQSLQLEETDITSTGIERLRQALPQCAIWYGPELTAGPLGIAPLP